MKKFLALLLVMVMVLGLCSCSSADGTDSDTTDTAEQFATLHPSTNLPSFSSEFNTVLDNTYISSSTINNAMGYILAAYSAYDVDTFCKYVYTENPLAIIYNIANEIFKTADDLGTDRTASSLKMAETLRLYAGRLITADAHLEGWIVNYVGYEEGLTTKPSSDDLIRAINIYANIFYGQDIL